MEQASSPASTLVVVLGASEWPSAPGISPLPACANSAFAVHTYFVDPDQFGLPSANILNLFDSNETQPQIDKKIFDFLKDRNKVLDEAGTPVTDVIVYYVGHGGFDDEGSRYYLAIRATEQHNAYASSISINALANTLRETARSVRQHLILDACFSAAAYHVFQSAPMEVVRRKVSEVLPAEGTALLCSAGPRDPSKAPAGATFTMFSGALMDVLKIGRADRGSYLSLADISDATETLIRERYPETAVRPEVLAPRQRQGDVSEVPIFPNAAAAG